MTVSVVLDPQASMADFSAAPEQVTVSGHGSMLGRDHVREVSVSLHWPLCDPATLGSATLFRKPFGFRVDLNL